MKLDDITYKDYLHYNTLIDLENQEIVVIDYENVLSKIPSTADQIRGYIDSLKVPDQIREKIEIIFEYSCQ